MDNPEISVVIPTHNRKRSLHRVLDALGAQTLTPQRFEVIVVSDGSTDGTMQAVREHTSGYRLRGIEQANQGPSAARNQGVRAACGALVVFLDDDVEPVPAFLEEHARAHSQDPRLVVIGPQSMPHGERFPLWIAWEHEMLERQYARFRSGEWSVGPNNLYSGNFSVRRDHLLEAGGFDERFRRQEDVELGFRLAASGMQFLFEPRANGWHRPERSLQSWFLTPYLYGVRDVQMSRDKGEGEALQLARKHFAQRNPATRKLARSVIGSRVLEPLVLSVLRAAIVAVDRTGSRRAGLPLCSLAFNLRYLQGMAKELGSARKMWGALRGPATEARAV